eukprot:11413171-Alexandrium_andersonii.AAC.1
MQRRDASRAAARGQLARARCKHAAMSLRPRNRKPFLRRRAKCDISVSPTACLAQHTGLKTHSAVKLTARTASCS